MIIEGGLDVFDRVLGSVPRDRDRLDLVPVLLADNGVFLDAVLSKAVVEEEKRKASEELRRKAPEPRQAEPENDDDLPF